ncbi:MAG: thermosome subunit alpha [Candidatus Woesearchaeota archaeon]
MTMERKDNDQPIYIMPEDTKRDTGRNAQSNNIMAAKIVGETVRTTLGPKGMDKMLVDSSGGVIVTNDGVTILEEMNIEHPAAKMIVEIAKTQEDEVGDGTTTAVVLAGELLKKAEELIDQKIHPTIITKGYRLASEKAEEILKGIAQKCRREDEHILKGIASTAMTGKGAESAKDVLSSLVVDAVLAVSVENEDGNILVDKNDLKLETRMGGSIEDTELIKGIVLDKKRVNGSMPIHVDDAKVALVDTPLEIRDTETEAKIQITQPEQMQAFLNMEEDMLKKMVRKIKDSGADVLLCQKGIDDVAQHFLAKEGIFAVRRVDKSDMYRLAKATGGKIVTTLDDLSPGSLGRAGRIEEKRIGDDPMVFVRDCVDAKAVTLLVRGGTEHVVEEVRRAIEDAVGDISSALKHGQVVGGAGSPEIELSRLLMKFAEGLSGREQLSVKAFAEAMEIIPRTLAENAGLDPIDTIVELKASHDRGEKWAGIDAFTGKTLDSLDNSVVEPLKVKTQAVSSASEVAILILRIDDVIAAGPQRQSNDDSGDY